MEHQPYLIIELNETRYGINAYAVQETFFLPEITPIPESPLDVVGVINLRGEVLPIVDLTHRFGFAKQPYRLSDSVVVLANQNNDRVGLIVNRTYEVHAIEAANITQAPGHHSSDRNYFIEGLAKLDSDLIPLLQPDMIIRYGTLLTDFHDPLVLSTLERSGESTSTSHNGKSSGNRANSHGSEEEQTEEQSRPGQKLGDHPGEHPGSSSIATGYRERVFFAHATPAEREVLLRRAQNLQTRTEEVSFSGLAPYAVVGLQGEFFALGLEVIHEFTDVTDVTPVPCCPPHIVGNLNLRGESLTLVDISGILNLPLTRSEQGNKAIVARLDQLVAGITVDSVFDVVYLRPADISPIPAAVHSLNDEYIRGVAPYQEQQMSILDLPKLLLSPELVVEESV